MITAAPTLAEYTRFHGMLISPGPAQRCIDSFTGKILFMPSSYSRGFDTCPLSDPKKSSQWQVPAINLSSYYCLVLSSLTGLSSALGMTETIDSRDDLDHDSVPGLQSRRNTRLVVDKVVRMHVCCESGCF